MLLLIGAVIIICIASSTKEQRAAAREKMRPLSRKLLLPLILVWLILLIPG